MIRGWIDADICVEVGLNYHLYRYYLTNINKELRVQLTQVRKYRRTYRKEQEIRKIRRKISRNPWLARTIHARYTYTWWGGGGHTRTW